MRWKWTASVFFLLVLFSCTNLVFPAVFPNAPTGMTLVLAAAVAWVGFWSIHVSRSRTFEPEFLLLFSLGLMFTTLGAYLSRAMIPPVPLSLSTAGVGPRVMPDGELEVAATRLHVSAFEELHAVTDVTVPVGRREGLVHVWRHDGRVLARTEAAQTSAEGRSGRVRLSSTVERHELPDPPVGGWSVTIETPDGRPVGRVSFEVLP
jgi:hypothetical protein